jgi:Flp pilus assembly protein TadD
MATHGTARYFFATLNPAPGTLNSERRSWIAGALIVLAVLIAYCNSLSSPFIFDDLPAITENPTIHHLWSAWSPPHDNTSGVTSRPVVNFSLAVNYALGGLDVRGYHALNLLIHICSALALFGIVRRTLLERPTSSFAKATEDRSNILLRQGYGGQVQHPTSKANHSLDVTSNPRTTSLNSNFSEAATPLAFTIALLWAVHPLQTESVTCVVQRTESLMGLFYLLTIYCFLRSVENRYQVSGIRCQVSGIRCQVSGVRSKEKPSEGGSNSALQSFSSSMSSETRRAKEEVLWWRLASIFCCLAGMATKEVMVSAPLMVLLYDRTFVAGTFREAWQQRRKFYLGLAATWLVLGYLMVTAGGSRGHAAGFGLGVTPWTYALTQCSAIIHYLRLSFWPHPLVLDYGTTVMRHLTDVLPQAILLVLLVLATILSLWRCPTLGFIGAWFFVILAPSSSVVPLVTQTIAEHRMYLPLASVTVLVVLGLHRLLGRHSAVIFLVLAVGLGCATVQRNKDYRSELTIWNDTVAKCPDNERAHNNFGKILLDLPGQLPDAIAEFQAALRIKPDYPEAHYNLGIALYKTGQVSEAISEYQAALRIDLDYADAHDNLGTVLLNLPGRLPDATTEYQAALRIKPDDANAHNGLGTALARQGQLAGALVQFEEAVRITPEFAGAHYNLGNALAQSGRLSEAIGQFELALQIKPDFTAARHNLEQARHDLAITQHPTSNAQLPTSKSE